MNWYDDNQSPRRQHRDEGMTTLKLILGIGLGLALGGFIFFASGLLFTNGIISSISGYFENNAKTSQLEKNQVNLALSLELEKIRKHNVQLELQKQAIEENNRLAAIQIQEEKRIKDEKWKAYYRVSDKCRPPETHEIRVECANGYIRAKASFEDLYRKGKI